jgi:hypothetical protein
MRRLLLSIIVLAGLPATPATAGSPATSCAAGTAIEDVNAYFASPGALLHGDYQRSIGLSDGRTLWTFQDAFVPNTLGGSTLIHNAGLVQTGRCFQLLRGGTGRAPKAWLMADSITEFHHWFWPLASATADDGTIMVFMAEMKELGDHYLSHVEPIATWVVTVRQSDLAVMSTRLAPDPTSSLFGWSITSDQHWTYLYGYCFRQFGFDPVPFGSGRGHDLGCSADVRVGRVRRGHLDDRPSYWNGTTWTSDASTAVPVMPRAGRPINPAQVRWTGRQFVAVTKAGDWFGNTIYIDTSPTAHGPWTTVSTIESAALCHDCDTYFASPVAWAGQPDVLTIGISNNTWDGKESRWYHPTVLSVAYPSPTRSPMGAK